MRSIHRSPGPTAVECTSDNSRMVPARGLEPLRPVWTTDFKSVMSTNFITQAIPTEYVNGEAEVLPEHVQGLYPAAHV